MEIRTQACMHTAEAVRPMRTAEKVMLWAWSAGADVSAPNAAA